MNTAKRLEHIEEYYFSRKLKEVGHLISQGRPIINLGIGSPDLMPPKSTLDSLIEALKSPLAHKYQSYKGIDLLRLAIKNFYFKNYKVDLDHEHEILPLIGSKEGIMHISLAFLNEGDEVLIPNPGYPTYLSVTKPKLCDALFGGNYLGRITYTYLSVTKPKLCDALFGGNYLGRITCRYSKVPNRHGLRAYLFEPKNPVSMALFQPPCLKKLGT